MNIKESQKFWLAVDYPLIQNNSSLDIKHTEDEKTVDLIERVCNNISQLKRICDNVSQLIVKIGTTVSYLVVFFFNSPFAGFAILLSAVPILYMGYNNGKLRYNARKDITKYERLASDYRWYLADRNAAAERNLFTFSAMFNHRLHETFEHIR